MFFTSARTARLKGSSSRRRLQAYADTGQTLHTRSSPNSHQFQNESIRDRRHARTRQKSQHVGGLSMYANIRQLQQTRSSPCNHTKQCTPACYQRRKLQIRS